MQPTSVLTTRERRISTACFIAGSLVATIELMAQTGFVWATLWTRTHSIAVAMKNAYGVMNAMHVAPDKAVRSFMLAASLDMLRFSA